VTGNHYRCGPDGDWPDWVYRMGSAPFGKCVPVAKPTLAVGGDDAKVEFGEMITIYGEHFAPSEELKCKVGAVAVLATFVSSVQIKCMTPSMCVNADQTNCLEPGTSYTISVANYGEDYSSVGTLASYVDSTVTTAFVSPSSPPAPPAPAVPERPSIPPVETGMSQSTRIGAAVGGAIGGVVVVGVAAYVVYLLLSKQMHKKPISVVVKETSVGVTAVSSTAAADIGAASASADVEMAGDEKI